MKLKKENSVQDLIGIHGFTEYGLSTDKGELLFFLVEPTNISVLSNTNIGIKIQKLMFVLSALPDIEISCTDSSECFDDNKIYLKNRLEIEENPKIKQLIENDIAFLDKIQTEMATARQFLFIARYRNRKKLQIFKAANAVEKAIADQGFEVHRMHKKDIKRFLALYFDASMQGELMPDVDGEQFSDFEERNDENEIPKK